MLTSLYIFFFFWKPLWAFIVTFAWNEQSLRRWSSVSSLSLLKGEAVQWVAAEVVGCSGEGGSDEMAPESPLAGGCCGVQCVSFLAFPSLPLMCIVRACRMLGRAPAGLQRRAHKAAYTQAPNGSQHERSRVVKALALSGNSWLGRHGGSWLLLLLFLLLVVSTEQSIENRHIYLLYIAYVAACSPTMNEVMSSLVLQKRSPATRKK